MDKGPKWTNEVLRCAVDLPGDLMEIGVFRGATLRLMLKARAATAKARASHTFAFAQSVWAVDSWQGMAKPGPHDDKSYPKGKFGHVTFEAFLDEMNRHGWPACSFTPLKGFVPQVLQGIPAEAQLSFVHIDLDQFQPTVDAASWAWKHLNPGGVLAFHDWYPAKAILAAAGISQFMHNVMASSLCPIRCAVEADEFIMYKPTTWEG